MPDLTHETWRPVVGYEGIYEVSDQGRVRSLDRVLADGRRWRGRILKPDRNDKRGYIRYSLSGVGDKRHFSAHRLVLAAFVGPCPPGMECRHLNGNESDCSLGNLEWGTPSENCKDRTRHGTWVNNNRFVNATHCVNGHKFDLLNTYWRPTGGRSCRACGRTRTREYAQRKVSL